MKQAQCFFLKFTETHTSKKITHGFQKKIMPKQILLIHVFLKIYSYMKGSMLALKWMKGMLLILIYQILILEYLILVRFK